MTVPDGFAVRLGPTVRHREHGRLLVGGAPTRVSRLSDTAQRLLAGGTLTVSDPTSRTLAAHLLATGLADPVTGRLPPVPADQITCVVPVRDRPDHLDRALAELGTTMAVVVVDDASVHPEPTRRVAERHRATVVRLDRNMGPAGARNAGLATVTTPYVVFVDSDVQISGDGIARLARHFTDPRVALVAPRILGSGHPAGWVGRYEAACSSLDRGAVSALVRPRSPVAWVPSAVLAARVEALGVGFDPGLRSGEDVDLVWRLARDDWLVRYDADVTARHAHLTSPAGWARRKAFYGTSAAPLAERHGDNVAPATLSPITAAVAVVALAQRPWSLGVLGLVAAGSTRELHRKLVGSTTLATELVARGVVDATAQTCSLLVRHWWPLTAVVCLGSRRARRAALVAAVADSALAARTAPAGSRTLVAVVRRLDDLAYGAGVWTGALRARSLRCLLPAVSRRSG